VATRPLLDPSVQALISPLERNCLRLGQLAGWEARMTGRTISKETLPPNPHPVWRIGWVLGYSGFNPNLFA